MNVPRFIFLSTKCNRLRNQMLEHNWERVEDDDPERCQSTNAKGQCHIRSQEDSKYCAAHSNRRHVRKVQAARTQQYQVALFKDKIARFENSDHLNTVRAEVAILKLLLETTLNQCTTDSDLMLKSQCIGDLVLKIEKLVTSCVKLDSRIGSTLDSIQAIQFAQEIIEIIGNHVSDHGTLEAIASDILESLDGKTKKPNG